MYIELGAWGGANGFAHGQTGHRRSMQLSLLIRAVNSLVGHEPVSVLLVLQKQWLVDDGNPHAGAVDPLVVQSPDSQAGVLTVLQNRFRVEPLRPGLRPFGTGVKTELMSILVGEVDYA